MSSKSGHLSGEKTLVALIILFFTMPLLLTALLSLDSSHRLHARWLRNESLSGMQLASPAIPFSWRNVISGKYQEQLGMEFNKGFMGRECLIRLGCEAWYRVFKQSALNTAHIHVGRHSNLFEEAYVREYCIERKPAAELAPLLTQLKQFQDVCERRGIRFALVLTPSKAALLPEALPANWLARMDARPRGYDLFAPLLKQYGVRYVDGHAISEGVKRSGLAPVFPKGGIHWGDEAALLTSEAILKELNAGENESIGHVRASMEPSYTDQDLAMLMNLAIPWTFLVARGNITRGEVPPEHQQSIVIVGGSFMWKMAEFLSKTAIFFQVDCFYYYKKWKTCFFDGVPQKIREPTGPVNFASEVFASQNIVVELNESMINNPLHVTAFLDAALEFDRKNPTLRAPLWIDRRAR